MKLIAALVLVIVSSSVWAGEFGPWNFGMTQKEVLAEKEVGPYRAFSNGDLETHNGLFFGRRSNFQFYFREDSLRRIAIRLYEGSDPDVATAIWQATYEVLEQRFGPIETPGITGSTTEELSARATALVLSGSNVELAPVAQPNDAELFATYIKHPHDGTFYYIVTVNLDQPRP